MGAHGSGDRFHRDFRLFAERAAGSLCLLMSAFLVLALVGPGIETIGVAGLEKLGTRKCRYCMNIIVHKYACLLRA